MRKRGGLIESLTFQTPVCEFKSYAGFWSFLQGVPGAARRLFWLKHPGGLGSTRFAWLSRRGRDARIKVYGARGGTEESAPVVEIHGVIVVYTTDKGQRGAVLAGTRHFSKLRKRYGMRKQLGDRLQADQLKEQGIDEDWLAEFDIAEDPDDE